MTDTIDTDIDYEAKFAEAAEQLRKFTARLCDQNHQAFPMLKWYRLALEIAPELRASPLYLLNDHPQLESPREVIAYVQQRPTPQTRAYLRESGEWRGLGPAIVFVQQDLSEQAFLATLLHELAHCLPAESYADVVEETPAADAADRATFAEWAADPEPVSTCKPSWAVGGHDRDFHLVALHLWWRAAVRGHFCSPHDVGFGLRYDLSDWQFYWHALGADAVKKQDLTFAEIVAEGPPELFRKLWRSDLSRFLELHPNAEKELANAVG